MSELHPTPSIRNRVSICSSAKADGRARAGLITTLAGFLVFLIGARPGLFGLDRSLVVGFISWRLFWSDWQSSAWAGFRPSGRLKDQPLSIAAEIGCA